MEKGLTCFWSRSRQELWLKGDTSGNYQHIYSITADCDRDALVVTVMKDGPACHLGTDSCFNEVIFEGEEPPAFQYQDLMTMLEGRKAQPKEGSYTTYLFAKGILSMLIADTELNIEYLTGTLRKYDTLVDYATVEITLEEVYVLSEQEQPVTGFWPRLAQAFSTGTARFVDDVQDFALGFARNWVGSLIWLAVIAAVIVLLVRWLRKGKKPLFSRRKKKAPAPPPAGGSAEEHK